MQGLKFSLARMLCVSSIFSCLSWAMSASSHEVEQDCRSACFTGGHYSSSPRSYSVVTRYLPVAGALG